jgi:hypothetical protein
MITTLALTDATEIQKTQNRTPAGMRPLWRVLRHEGPWQASRSVHPPPRNGSANSPRRISAGRIWYAKLGQASLTTRFDLWITDDPGPAQVDWIGDYLNEVEGSGPLAEEGEDGECGRKMATSLRVCLCQRDQLQSSPKSGMSKSNTIHTARGQLASSAKKNTRQAWKTPRNPWNRHATIPGAHFIPDRTSSLRNSCTMRTLRGPKSKSSSSLFDAAKKLPICSHSRSTMT